MSQVPRLKNFFFHDGDSPIVFLGDSITEQRQYTTLIEDYILTRYPKWKVTFRNLGWGGDTMTFQKRIDFETGLKRDILPLQPACMTIDFGMNDARASDSGLDRYVKHARRLAEELKKAHCRFAFVSSSPEEKYEDSPGGSHYNLMLEKYTTALQQVAVSEGVPFVDQLHPFISAIESGRKSGVLGKNGLPRLIPDAVHPDWAGQLIMADIILKDLGAEPMVSEAVINGGSGKVSSTNKCKVTKVTRNPAKIEFTRLDESLPMPIPEECRLSLLIPGFDPLNDLSRYSLIVTSLPAAEYDISIDGRKVASHTAAELAKGINLTMECGPIREQALELHKLVIKKNDLFFERWRKVQLFELPRWCKDGSFKTDQEAELKRLDKQIVDFERQIDDLRQPKLHKFAIAVNPNHNSR